ncbi:hypothetical protein MAL1_00064 [Bacteriophage DSS3_MAL1]|nr:hypothetical protein MAL1_00064 [Bacteriophage DSS3_MAL1]
MSVNNFFNAAYDKVTIYDNDGAPHECTRLNARELVARGDFKWDAGSVSAAAIEAAAPAEPTPTPEPAEVAEAPEAAPSPVDHINDPLSVIADTIAGDADVAKYLEGFTADALRTMAEERYGEKIAARTSKDKAIEKIMAFEEQKLASEIDE